MRFTPNRMKWALRFYPPFLFQRIWVQSVHDGFMGADVKIFKSLFNINSNGTIFGGTTFSSIDPIHPLLIDGYLRQHGFKKTVAWLKSAHIDFKKPGKNSLLFSVRIKESEMQAALAIIREEGKIIKTFTTEIFDTQGTLCAVSHNEIYIRDLTFDFSQLQQQVESTNTQ